MTMNLILPYKPNHPLLPPPTREQAQRIIEAHGLQEFNARMQRRNDAIRREEEDPLHYGWEPPLWKLADVCWGWITWEEFVADEDVPVDYKVEGVRQLTLDPATFLLILGGNRASKTYYMCKRILQCGLKYPRGVFWVFHDTHAKSVLQHHKMMDYFLPKEIQETGKTKHGYISYTDKNGFSDSKFVLPNRSVFEFRNYEQNVKTLEGPELGDPEKRPCLGWIGDELMPVEFVETLRFRNVTFNAVGMLGFTAVDGYSPTVQKFRDGASLILERGGEYLEKPEPQPLLRVCQNRKQRIINFHSEFNPYGNFKGLLDEVANDPDSVRKVRLYGEPEAARDVAFPRFSDKVHVKARKDFPKDLTWWLINDPGGAKRKPMAMIWVGVDVYDRLWVLREFPCPRERIPGIGYPGPWAKAGKAAGHKYDGVPDDGSKTFGWDLIDYKEEIARIEEWEDAQTNKPIREWQEMNGAKMRVEGRYIDSRFADTPSYTSTGNTTLLEEFADIGLYFDPTSGSASSGRIKDGVDLITNKIGYQDNWTCPEDGPGLFIAEECENLIFALKIWTGLDGNKGATKDWIDLLRYALMARIYHVAPAERQITKANRHASKSRHFRP